MHMHIGGSKSWKMDASFKQSIAIDFEPSPSIQDAPNLDLGPILGLPHFQPQQEEQLRGKLCIQGAELKWAVDITYSTPKYHVRVALLPSYDAHIPIFQSRETHASIQGSDPRSRKSSGRCRVRQIAIDSIDRHPDRFCMTLVYAS